MATQAQIENALTISGTYSLISGAATITDVTNYAGIGIASPDTVKILLWIVDSAQQLVYKNSGYDTANFGSPDMEPLAGDTTYTFTLPTDITGAYLQGQYTVNMKVQVVEGSDTTNAFKTLYQNILGACNGIVASVAPNVTYNTAVVSVTDNTNYKAYTGLANTLTLYPPAPSLQASQTGTFNGSPATLFYEPDPGLYPYTGVWSWTLSSQVTYTDPTTQASVTCLITKQGSFEVVQSQLCKVYCLIKQARAEAITMAAQKQTYAEIYSQNVLKAEGEYILAYAASVCGKPQSEIDVYIESIYKLINKSPDCNCGCDDGTSQPLVPTSIIHGADGTDGSQIYSGTGAPSGSLGAVNDYYIDTNTTFLYKKTGASTWTYLLTMQGTAGTDGASFLQGNGVPSNGDGNDGDTYLDLDTGDIYLKTAGAWAVTGNIHGFDGVQLLENLISDSATAGTSWETLKTYTVAAGQLSTNKDLIHIRARFKSSGTIQGQACRVQFNGSTLAESTFTNTTSLFVFDLFLSRITQTTAKYDGQIQLGQPFLSVSVVTGSFIFPITSIAGLDWDANSYTITAQGDSVVIGDVVCEELQITYYHKS